MSANIANAIARMKKRGTKKVSWTYLDKRIEFSYISANMARNYDGSHAGFPSDPERLIVQRKVQCNGRLPHYTNYW